MHRLWIGKYKIFQLTDNEHRRIDMLERLEPCDLLSVQEVAGRLDITERTVYKYIKDERIQAVKIGGMWRVSVAAYMAFVYGKSAEGMKKAMALIKDVSEQMDLIRSK